MMCNRKSNVVVGRGKEKAAVRKGKLVMTWSKGT
jgi:hypothetical protein